VPSSHLPCSPTHGCSGCAGLLAVALRVEKIRPPPKSTSFSVFYLRAIYKMADGAEGRGRGQPAPLPAPSPPPLSHRPQVVVVLAVVSLAAVIAETAAVVDVVSIPPHPTRTAPCMPLLRNDTLCFRFSVHFTPPSDAVPGGRGGRGGPRRGGDADKDAWNPITKLGRLVKARKIDSLEHIFLYSMPIKEYQIIDHFFPKASLSLPRQPRPAQPSTTLPHSL
jgi:hypothetical protein